MNDTNYLDFTLYEDCFDTPQESNSIRDLSLVLYCLTCVLGVPGNALVLYIAGAKMKRTVNTIWFLNLAIADLLCCLSVPFTVSVILLDYWPFGNVMCKVLSTIIVLNMFASVFTLNFISLDRLFQVVKPVWAQNNRSLRLACGCCVIAWLMAVLLSLPTMMLRSTEDYCNKTICTFPYYSEEDEDTNSTSADASHQYALLTVNRFVFGFIIPLLCITVCYALIAWKVSNSQFRSSRTFRIMLTVVGVFFLSWLPYHVVGLTEVYGEEQVAVQARAVDSLVISLAYINSCMNPILYMFMGQDFKERVKLSLRRAFEKAFSDDGPSSLNSKGLQSNSTEIQL